MLMTATNLKIPILLWLRLLKELKRRGMGRRESGAFLMGKVGAAKISSFVCYDDLDPSALDTEIIVFHGAGFVPLWSFCERKRMRVLADVHTHPGRWTGQSEADRTNPMISQPGHIALILPHFARRKLLALDGVGVFKYLGDHRWTKQSAGKEIVRLTLL
jgi:proteasome lid subunit RPN8/RPN11